MSQAVRRPVRWKIALAMGITMAGFTMAGMMNLITVKDISNRFNHFLVEDQAYVDDLNTLYAQGLQSEQALRNILLDPGNQTAQKNLKEASTLFEATHARLLSKTPEADPNRAKVLSIGETWNKKSSTAKAVIEAGQRDLKGAIQLLNSSETPLWRSLKETLVHLLADKKAKATLVKEQVSAQAERSVWMSAIATLASLLVGSAFGFGMTRAITRPISRLRDLIQSIAKGDLTQETHLESQDEFMAMAEDLNQTTAALRESLLQIQESARTISTASAEISMGNTDLSRRTEEQAASLEETASSMEQITSNVNQTADNAKSANLESTKARLVAQDGGIAVTQVIAAMEAINQSSAKINEIIGVVDEIAFQTNLLALNAAVEAARAGEQGRGFAVVAAEVRNLAKRSAEAAKEIKGLIRESVAKSTHGNQVAAHAGGTITEVVANVQRVTSLISEIAAATREQSLGLAEVNKAVVQMDEVTQQNAALVEESAAAADSLDGQAQILNGIVARFKTSAVVY